MRLINDCNFNHYIIGKAEKVLLERRSIISAGSPGWTDASTGNEKFKCLSKNRDKSLLNSHSFSNLFSGLNIIFIRVDTIINSILTKLSEASS